MAARPRALRWRPCDVCGTPTRGKSATCPSCVENPPAPATGAGADAPAKRRRPIESGWCMSGRHGRCSHLLQTATDKRPEILCSCRCHRLVRNLTWARVR
jgi:hypothetical protein